MAKVAIAFFRAVGGNFNRGKFRVGDFDCAVLIVIKAFLEKTLNFFRRGISGKIPVGNFFFS